MFLKLKFHGENFLFSIGDIKSLHIWVTWISLPVVLTQSFWVFLKNIGARLTVNRDPTHSNCLNLHCLVEHYMTRSHITQYSKDSVIALWRWCKFSKYWWALWVQHELKRRLWTSIESGLFGFLPDCRVWHSAEPSNTLQTFLAGDSSSFKYHWLYASLLLFTSI